MKYPSVIIIILLPMTDYSSVKQPTVLSYVFEVNYMLEYSKAILAATVYAAKTLGWMDIVFFGKSYTETAKN